jgi:predicted dehydrogenase
MKILILGMGSIGQRHYGLIKKHFPEIEVTFHVESSNQDTVFICNPTEYHIDTAIKCIHEMPNLRNIFCEKPLDVSSKRLQELKEIVSDRIFYLAYPLRFNPVIQEVNKQSLHKNIDIVCYSNSDKWPSKRKLNDVMLELSHEIDLAYYLNGEFHKITKISSGGTRVLLMIDHVGGEKSFLDLDMKSKKSKDVRLINILGTRYDYQVSDLDYLAQLRYFLGLCAKRSKNHMNDLEEAGKVFFKIEGCLK